MNQQWHQARNIQILQKNPTLWLRMSKHVKIGAPH